MALRNLLAILFVEIFFQIFKPKVHGNGEFFYSKTEKNDQVFFSFEKKLSAKKILAFLMTRDERWMEKHKEYLVLTTEKISRGVCVLEN